MMRLKKIVTEILSLHTGNSAKKIEKDTDRDYFMTAEESVKYGLGDKIIQSTKISLLKKNGYKEKSKTE